ncbi:hypothetical protein JMJ55_04285 [Belnapia sp. T6]|uniref:Uncharacterized protein n=1 Tax=Belnapia mucosa TaxID=2804532 RepID=A0ABS1UYK5_9PROT|nr:hypothetical protein [Belnapia mucosa]MBL6454530.1 hypothetical protein [Belnapia mucosa]
MDGARTVRIRAYLGEVRDVGRTFRVTADADLAATMKRAALAALPKTEGWHLAVFSVERTSESERIAPFLDRLARRHMGERDFAAVLVATLDGARAVLAVAVKDTALIRRLRAALVDRRH